MHISVHRGLDIPLAGEASPLIETAPASSTFGLDLGRLTGKKGLRVLVEEGDQVLIGQAIAEDRDLPERKIAAVCSGRIQQIVRGQRRSVETMIIAHEPLDPPCEEPLQPHQISREQLLEQLLRRGLVSHIRQRPFNRIADLRQLPRSIFVKALESAPFAIQPDTQLSEDPISFQAGLDFLSQIAPVHLVHRRDSCEAISQAARVIHHTVSGSHPKANPSVHIHFIDPIDRIEERVWTLTAWDVLVIGKSLTQGRYFCEKIVAVAGQGVLAKRRTYLRTQLGSCLAALLSGRIADPEGRIICGDPLMGKRASLEDHLGMEHSCVCVLEPPKKRQWLHFLRLGRDKYTASATYLSHFLPKRPVSLTTSQHGELRAFIDGELYERFMPMRVPTMQLAKAILARDFDQAVRLGLLEVDSEDFALPTFVCPSKIDLVAIVSEALEQWANERL